jgi:hypothetical protein
MDLDLSDDESDALHHTPVPRSSVLFDARGEQRPQRGPMSDMPRAAQSARERDDEDMWAELG